MGAPRCGRASGSPHGVGGSGSGPDGFFPDGDGGFDFFEVPLADFEGGGAVFGVDAEEEAGFEGGDEAEAVLDEDAVGAVLGEAFFEEGGEGFLGHGEVGGVVDAGDGLAVFGASDGAEELDLGAFFGFEAGGFGEDGVGGEEEGHVRLRIADFGLRIGAGGYLGRIQMLR